MPRYRGAFRSQSGSGQFYKSGAEADVRAPVGPRAAAVERREPAGVGRAVVATADESAFVGAVVHIAAAVGGDQGAGLRQQPQRLEDGLRGGADVGMAVDVLEQTVDLRIGLVADGGIVLDLAADEVHLHGAGGRAAAVLQKTIMAPDAPSGNNDR